MRYSKFTYAHHCLSRILNTRAKVSNVYCANRGFGRGYVHIKWRDKARLTDFMNDCEIEKLCIIKNEFEMCFS